MQEERGSGKRITKLLSVLLILMIAAAGLSACSSGDSGKEEGSGKKQEEKASGIEEDGEYSSKDDVAAYIYKYDRLPKNFITKKEARKLGWRGGSLEEYAPGKAIGGDVFGNREKRLPKGKQYFECDIDTVGRDDRGPKRIVFAKGGPVYYTGDHYRTFEEVPRAG